MGLAIVKEITQLHGGSVRVESQSGKGATFTVSFPFYNPSFALTEEFRVMREQASREGRSLAFQLLQAKPGRKMPAVAVELLKQQISREDRILENPGGGILLLSVLDAEGFQAMRRRIQDFLNAQPEAAEFSELGWGWALVPREETTLPGVLELARRRAYGEGEAARV